MNKKSNTGYFKLAIELENRYSKILISEQVHFRANLNSISLISVDKKRPELGVTCKSHNEWNEKIIESYIFRIKSKPVPQRSTPEKSLQAWIIKQSQENEYSLILDKSIKFITSELAFVDDIKGKILSDIIGFDNIEKRLVIIELKSERLLKRLIQQVDNFEYIISENQSFFDDLMSLHGCKAENEPLKAIVWPNARTSPLSKLEELGIDEFVYEKGENEYVIKKV